MAARQDATHREDTSVQGLVAAEGWEVQNDQATNVQQQRISTGVTSVMMPVRQLKVHHTIGKLTWPRFGGAPQRRVP